MIYNLVQYLKDNVSPVYSYAINGAHKNTPDNCIIVNETTGIPEKFIDRVNHTTQIFSRAKSSVTAKEQIQNVFDKVDRYWDLILPETNITLEDGSIKIYPEVLAYQVTPLQKPTWFGYDENGLAKYVFNLQIITK